MKRQDRHFFDNPRHVAWVMRALYAACALAFALDFAIHRHVSHRWENLWGFYAIYGFIGCVLLVLIAKWMRGFLMRDEEYYERAGDRKEGGHVDD
jgi:hypothetical protein